MRPIAGDDTKQLFYGVQNFVKEKEHLRCGDKNILLLIDGYVCHISFKTLNLLKENRIIMEGVLSNTSNVLQSLDISVFDHLKE